jgi:hypothetical protein
MLSEFKVGIPSSPLSDATEVHATLGNFGQILSVTYPARYYEAVRRDQVFSAVNAAAGVAPGTAVSTTPPFTLWNPTGSGKNLVVLSASCSIISGTLGVGTVFFETVAQAAAPSGGTELSTTDARVGGGVRSTGRAFTGSTIATPSIVRPAFAVYAGATDPVFLPLDGAIVLAPGYALALEETGGAGTSPKVAFSMTWAEVAI